MDDGTRTAYERGAASYAQEWEDEQDAPTDLYDLLAEFFTAGTAFDVGCGSGRDAAWLSAHGYQVTGFDGSPALLEQARRRHPGTRFETATLPDLAELTGRSAANVLCETVLMHLPSAEIGRGAARLYDLVEPGGVLYLSWRVTTGADVRDDAGRLYTAFPAGLVREALNGAVVLHDAEQRSASSGKVIHRVIVRRPARATGRGRPV